jgi:hypothetical protein
MLMAARQFDYLRHLGFRDLKSVNAANAYSMPMNVEHNLNGLVVRLAEKALQHMHDEFHRSVVVIEDKHPVQGRLFGFCPRPGDNTGTSAAIS